MWVEDQGFSLGCILRCLSDIQVGWSSRQVELGDLEFGREIWAGDSELAVISILITLKLWQLMNHLDNECKQRRGPKTGLCNKSVLGEGVGATMDCSRF